MTTPFDITKPYSLRNGRKCEVHKLAEPVAARVVEFQIRAVLQAKRRDALLNQESGK